MTEKYPELLEHPAYKAATLAVAKAVKGRDEAQAAYDRLAAGVPSVPTATQRAMAWLSGSSTAVKKADVSAEELDAAKADLDMMQEAVRLAGEAAEVARAEAVKQSLRDRLPTHKAMVGEVCDALDAAVTAVDNCAEFVGECNKMTKGGSIGPLHQNVLPAAFLAQLRHQAKEFRANVSHYVEDAK